MHIFYCSSTTIENGRREIDRDHDGNNDDERFTVTDTSVMEQTSGCNNTAMDRDELDDSTSRSGYSSGRDENSVDRLNKTTKL